MEARKRQLLPEQAKSITTNNGTDNAMFNGVPANMIWVGGSGHVNLFLHGGPDDVANDLVLQSVIAGTWHYMPPFRRVYAQGTTATVIVVGVCM